MKPYTYALLAAAAACGLASAAETAYTTPVGYVALGDTTVGQPAIKAFTDVAVSVPLHRPTEYAGQVASTTSTTVTLSGTPAWTSNQWAPGASTPYLVTVNSGAENGFTGLITGNTADTLTITPVTGGSLTNVVATDKVKIYKAWTLITLFPPGTFTSGVRVFGFSGTTSGINLAADLNYLWNATTGNWTRGTTISNDVIFYPGESFFIRTIGTQVASLTLSGEVPTSNSRTFVDKFTAGVGQDTRVGYISPVDELIGSSGLSAVLTSGDRLFGFNNNAAGINKAPVDNLLWNATTGNWTSGTTIVNGTYTLKPGMGYFVRRLANAPVGAGDWKDQPSYLPLP